MMKEEQHAMTLNRQAIRQEFNREMTKARERITTTANGEIGWLVQLHPT